MRLPLRLGLLACVALAFQVAIHFPYATDAPPSPAEVAKTIAYYQQAYSEAPPAETNDDYVKVAQEAAATSHVRENLQDFVGSYGLAGKRALDVGAGRGYLQDVVEDYTGLEISPSARRFYHKPFVLGSATAMPFSDNQFDVVWSIWVLEHIPNPEQALREMRRVTKDGGILYLMPAWLCTTWASQGYEVRPYSDFGIGGRLIKTSLPLRRMPQFVASYVIPARMPRLASYEIFRSPATLHYRRLQPNYDKYWVPDSDATSSIDWYEALLWFESRGDEPLNRASLVAGLRERMRDPRLMIRVRKH